MTWTIDGGYYLLFPLAGNDLDEFWANDPRPIRNSATDSWIAKQMVGLASALESIHNPPSNTLQLPQDHMYGRHGDIKPENVLWYPSPTDGRGHIGTC